jgi:ketosteroid isomerase-like protein
MPMTKDKKSVERYMDGFRRGDREQILSCLTDDVEWQLPGVFLAKVGIRIPPRCKIPISGTACFEAVPRALKRATVSLRR